jgi:polyhydroxybutyrate depolymerase
MYDDSLRTYVVYEPTLEPNLVGHPLVIGLHGTGADGPTFIATASLIKKANKEKFILACPNALLHNLFTYFNVGGEFEELIHGTDDLGFISAQIDTMIKNYHVDTTRIYVPGFSNGSAMSHRFAVELSHKIAAIGAVSGQMVYEYCDPEFPVPIIQLSIIKNQ